MILKTLLPESISKPLQPYVRLARLDKPIGIWLLLFPCLFALSLADNVLFHLDKLILFSLGATVMRAAGCIYNDMIDRDLDAQVARTRTRPLASGEISLAAAVTFLIILLATGLLILLQFNQLTVFIGALSLIPIALYPFMKRFTYWPQAFLGITFNWGALLGWTAVTASPGLTPLILYAACFLWTLGYDTIYAHQDRHDDILIGVKSTALALGDRSRLLIAACYTGVILLLAGAGYLQNMNNAFYVGLAVAALMMGAQVIRVDFNNSAACLAAFKQNQWVGLVIWVALIAGRF